MRRIRRRPAVPRAVAALADDHGSPIANDVAGLTDVLRDPVLGGTWG